MSTHCAIDGSRGAAVGTPAMRALGRGRWLARATVLLAFFCASAAADEYPTHPITISSSKPNPPFDIRSDVIPVIQMTRFTFALYVNPTLPVKSVAELVAYAKTRPGQLNYASVGTGSTTHLAFEVIKLNTGMDIVHVPFKGTAQTAAAVMAGDVQVGLDAIAAVKGNFDSGRLRPLAVISAQRTPPMPSLPGMKDAGVAGVDIISYTGVAAPAKMPKAIVDLLKFE